MNVLSLFGGYGGAIHCLKKAGISINNYYESEIEEYPMLIAKKHHPEIQQVGDVIKWFSWDINWGLIDLVIAGSPCQGFSRAGELGGTKCVLKGVESTISDRETYIEMKAEGAEFLSQSHLFWEFILCLDLIKRCNPNVKFMLENVIMSKENEQMITETLGVDPIMIDAGKLSVQARERLYWCNFDVSQPKDLGRKVSEVLEPIEGDRPCILREKSEMSSRSLHHIADASDINGNQSIKRVYSVDGKCPTLTTMGGGHREPKFLMPNGMYRKAAVLEIERIAGLPDHYTAGVSDTQRKKMIGNGWEINTVTHILREMTK